MTSSNGRAQPKFQAERLTPCWETVAVQPLPLSPNSGVALDAMLGNAEEFDRGSPADLLLRCQRPGVLLLRGEATIRHPLKLRAYVCSNLFSNFWLMFDKL